MWIHPTYFKFTPGGYYWFRTPKTYNLCVVAFMLSAASVLLYASLLCAQDIVSNDVFAVVGVREELFQVMWKVSGVITLLALLGAIVEYVLYLRREKTWYTKFEVVSSLVKQAVQRRLDRGEGKVKGWGKGCTEEMLANVDLHDFNSCAYYIVENIQKLMPVDELQDTDVGRSHMRALIDSVVDTQGDIDQLRKQHGYSSYSSQWQKHVTPRTSIWVSLVIVSVLNIVGVFLHTHTI